MWDCLYLASVLSICSCLFYCYLCKLILIIYCFSKCVSELYSHCVRHSYSVSGHSPLPCGLGFFPHSGCPRLKSNSANIKAELQGGRHSTRTATPLHACFTSVLGIFDSFLPACPQLPPPFRPSPVPLPTPPAFRPLYCCRMPLHCGSPGIA